MSRLVCDHAAILKKLHTATPAQRKKLLAGNNKNLMRCLCECAKNILKGNVPLTTPQKKALRRHRQKLNKLVLKKTPAKTKKKIVQSGGFLGAILSPIVGLLGRLFGIGSD